MTGRKQQLILHVAGCAIFLALPFLFSPESLNLHFYLTNPPTQRDIIAYVLVLGAFYANYYLLIPRFFFLRKYVRFLVLNQLGYCLISFLPHILIPQRQRPAFIEFGPGHRPGEPNPTFRPPYDTLSNQPGPPPGERRTNQPGPPSGERRTNQLGGPPFGRPRPSFRSQLPVLIELSNHFFVFLVVLFLALLLKIRDRWIRAEEEKLHAELAYLKTQINPHFLFNTLNSIYAMALGRSEQTADAIQRLAAMMRYVLTDTGREKVPLRMEIAYLIDYIELQKTRFEGALPYRPECKRRSGGQTDRPALTHPFCGERIQIWRQPRRTFDHHYPDRHPRPRTHAARSQSKSGWPPAGPASPLRLGCASDCHASCFRTRGGGYRQYA